VSVKYTLRIITKEKKNNLKIITMVGMLQHNDKNAQNKHRLDVINRTIRVIK